ncbi:MAG: hypothetical protein V1898_01185 [Patescibacteria group bacterium]
MKKTLIMLAVLTIIFAGCGASEKIAETTAEKAIENATGAEVDIDNSNVNITTADGNTITTGQNISLPDDFPSDVPVYTDKKILAASTTAENQFALTMSSTDSYNEIDEFYQTELESNGWTIESHNIMAISGNTSIFVAKKDGRNLSVGIYSYEENDEISIVINVE